MNDFNEVRVLFQKVGQELEMWTVGKISSFWKEVLG